MIPPAPEPPAWRLAHGRSISFERPRVMAIVNVTPDSFHAPSRADTAARARDAAERAAGEGAAIIDIGGESTRPGAPSVDADEQIRRVAPAIEAIRRAPGALGSIPISADTTSARVARAALDAGADAINDVSAGRDDPAMFALVAGRACGLVLMHRLVAPARDSYSDAYAVEPVYDDVVRRVREFLAARLADARAAGVPADAVVLDPGLGFGKSVKQNLELIARTRELAALGRPVLSGASRKSFTGAAAGWTGSRPGQRLAPTLALSVLHLAAGARLFRVHDVGEHAGALAAAWAALGSGGAPTGAAGAARA